MKTNLTKLFAALALTIGAGLLWAQQAKMVPSALRDIQPPGARRGATVTFTLIGVNLSEAKEVFFDDPAITGKIMTNDQLPMTNKNQVKVEATIGANARLGIHRVFLQTPYGTTGAVTFAVGDWQEIAEKEPNNALTAAQSVHLPCTVIGKMDDVGDADCFAFEAKAGQELVFQVIATPIRSSLNSVLTLFRIDRVGGASSPAAAQDFVLSLAKHAPPKSVGVNVKVLVENNDNDGQPDSLLGYRFAADGTYVIRIRDFENRSGGYYRLNIGAFPYVTHVFPLGVRQSRRTLTQGDVGNGDPAVPIVVKGFNLGETKVSVKAPDETWWGKTMPLPVDAINDVKIAVGEYPEVTEVEGNNDVVSAQRVSVPVTVNGRISDARFQISDYGNGGQLSGNPKPEIRNPKSEMDCFRFSARKGQTLILEVMARRLGSPLDSVIEVLDAKGKPIERATLRPVAETALTLSDRDSVSSGFRLLSWTDLQLNDFVYCGGEVLQVYGLPLGPDEDVRWRNFRGQRLTFLDTTPTAHAVNTPLYKVQIHPPGKTFPPNGMPVFRVYYRNDDGGPLYGKDSRLFFTAPADGDYIVRVTDALGRQGERYAYRLTIREPKPDFRLTMSPEHPNVPLGSSVPITITAERLDGFDGEIEVWLEGLPEGFTATRGLIEQREFSCTLTIAHDGKSQIPNPKSQIRVVGKAHIGGKELVRTIEPDAAFGGVRLLTVLPKPDITVTTDLREVIIRPGQQVVVTAKVERHNGYAQRVPIIVQNLPFGVRVLDVGLNGVLITEEQTERAFVIYCEPWVKHQVRPFYCSGRVESDPSFDYASPPIVLKVEANVPSAAKPAAVDSSPK